MVEYDSIILPGREGKVTPEVEVGNLHNSTFNKSVTVLSDATNEPSLKLSLKGSIKSYIEVEMEFIRYAIQNGKLDTMNITVLSEKTDLKITDVSFVARDGSDGPEWQAKKPTAIGFKTSRSEKPKKDSYFEYTIRIWLKELITKTQNGEFIFLTNHVNKPEIKVPGLLDVVNQN